MQNESSNAMETPFKLNLNGVEKTVMEVKPPFDDQELQARPTRLRNQNCSLLNTQLLIGKVAAFTSQNPFPFPIFPCLFTRCNFRKL
jgi:hypothetical protein